MRFTVWDEHTYGNYFWDSPCGMYIPTERISGIHRVGCTYLRKWFLGFTMWDVHTYGNDWVSMPRPIAHGPSLGPTRAYPRRFLGRVGRTPLSPTLTWRWFQMSSWKGVLNRLFRTSLYQCWWLPDLDLPPIYSHIFQNPQKHPRKHFSTAATFCSHEIPSWAISSILPEGDSFTEGIYINSIALPMKRE